MAMTKWLFLLSACAGVLGGPAAAADVAPAPPPEWRIYPTPPDKSDDWRRANYSQREWRVTIENGAVVIRTAADAPKPVYTDRPLFNIPDAAQRMWGCPECAVKVSDGWLSGYNKGEFGGKLWWTDFAGNRPYQVMGRRDCRGDKSDAERFPYIGNIVALRKRSDTALVFAGLAHLMMDEGVVGVARQVEGKWQTCVLTDLKSAPDAVADDGDDLWLVLTTIRLVRFHGNGLLDELGSFPFLDKGLYPNSMVKLPDGTLYVGMRHFVARLIPGARDRYRSELLVPSAMPLFDPDGPLFRPSKPG